MGYLLGYPLVVPNKFPQAINHRGFSLSRESGSIREGQYSNRALFGLEAAKSHHFHLSPQLIKPVRVGRLHLGLTLRSTPTTNATHCYTSFIVCNVPLLPPATKRVTRPRETSRWFLRPVSAVLGWADTLTRYCVGGRRL